MRRGERRSQASLDSTTAAHQRLRRQLAPLVAEGGVACWRCGRIIAPGAPWDLGHDDHDRSIYRGPEHRRCNRSAAAVKRNRMYANRSRPARLDRSRVW